MYGKPDARKALIELHYLPSVQFFSKLLAYEAVIIEQHEHYQKGSYRNRCRLAGANSLQVLSIPLEKGKHQKLPIRDVRIAYDQPWHVQHWRTICSAYANAPFFPFYSDAVGALFRQPPPHLFTFNLQLLEMLIRQLQLNVRIEFSTAYQAGTDAATDDLRNTISPKPGRQAGDPFFKARPYPQVFLERHGFLPNLSILDLLFCTGPQAVQILRNCTCKNPDP